VTRPAVLLLDEPLGSLDPHLRGEMQAEILRLQRTLAIPAVMVTHDQQEAMMMADRIAVLHEGRLRQIGTPREIYSTPASAFVARFIGAANIFDIIEVRADGGLLKLATGNGITLTAEDDGKARRDGVSALVRPEAVRLGAPCADLENVFPARVMSVAYAGPVMRCQFELGGNVHLTATVPADSEQGRISPQDEVIVGWRAASVVMVPRE